MNNSITRAAIFVLSSGWGLLSAPLAAQEASPAEIAFKEPGLAPEGIAYDPGTDRFFVSSITTGGVHAVEIDGSDVAFARDARAAHTLGLRVDEVRGRVLAVTYDPIVFSDAEAEGSRGLAAFELTTGQVLFHADFGDVASGRSFANDVAFDGDGMAYVTDSFSDTIFAVSPEGEPSVLLQDDRFDGTPVEWLGDINFGLGGIDFHPDGYLLTSHNGLGRLYRVDLSDPVRASQVRMPDFFAADGLVVSPDGNRLYGAAFGKVVELTSKDGWESAAITRVSEGHEPITTLTWRDGELFGLYAYIGALFGAPEPDAYKIVRINFDGE